MNYDSNITKERERTIENLKNFDTKITRKENPEVYPVFLTKSLY